MTRLRKIENRYKELIEELLEKLLEQQKITKKDKIKE